MRTRIHRIGRAAAAASFAVAVCLASAALGPACGTSGEEGYCTQPWECVSTHNFLPGSNCTNNQCTCSYGEVACCERGAKNCNLACRPPENCEPDGGGLGGGGGSGSGSAEGAGGSGGGGGEGGGGGVGGAGGGSGGAPPECVSAADCAGPADARCGEATCEAGVCGLKLLAKPGELVPLASQKKGDCLTVVCDGTGNSLSVSDPADLYNDGKVCSIDLCGASGPENLFFEDGLPCPGGSGYCFKGQCVECIGILPGPTQNCGQGNACDYTDCVPGMCVANDLCGGSCSPCAAGHSCSQGSDCKDSVCSPQGMCALPSCSDSMKNDGETDADCGVAACGTKCADGKGCASSADCVSGVCWAAVCEAPTCSDAMQNGGEAGIDCGGPCAACL